MHLECPSVTWGSAMLIAGCGDSPGTDGLGLGTAGEAGSGWRRSAALISWVSGSHIHGQAPQLLKDHLQSPHPPPSSQVSDLLNALSFSSQ